MRFICSLKETRYIGLFASASRFTIFSGWSSMKMELPSVTRYSLELADWTLLSFCPSPRRHRRRIRRIFSEIPDSCFAPRIRGRVEGALASELAYFISCVASGEQPQAVTAQDGLESIRVARALVESAESEQDVVLERDADAKIRTTAP